MIQSTSLTAELYFSLGIIGAVLVIAVFYIGFFMKKMREEGDQ